VAWDRAEVELWLRRLLEDEQLARDVSAAARERAIAIFGKPTVMQQWKTYLDRA
jgi:hypothetical protein